MTFFSQLLASGIVIGVMYALVALGFVIIFKCSKVFNIAQGHFVLVGGYLGYTFLVMFNLPIWLAMLATIATAIVIGIVIERLALRPMIGQPVLAIIMMTIALAVIIEGTATLIWQGKYLTYPEVFGTASLHIGSVSLSTEAGAGFVISIATVAIFIILFRYTKSGLAMRATAEDEQVVQSAGIKVSGVYRLAWVVAAATGVIAGVLLGGICGVSPPLSEIGMKALAVILLGGLESIPGAIIGGIIIGVLEIMASGYLDPLLPTGGGLASIFPFIVMILVLIVKPYGLFGLTRIERI